MTIPNDSGTQSTFTSIPWIDLKAPERGTGQHPLSLAFPLTRKAPLDQTAMCLEHTVSCSSLCIVSFASYLPKR